jgi:hypothetical protein
MTALFKAILARLRAEPVAVYGSILSALLVILASAGVSADTIALIVTIAGVLGIPITRAQVTPAKTAKAP